jgi:ABC-type nickel/cobalt efflux system permease component RcnA
MRRLLLLTALTVAGFAVLPTAPASAHPLGNFSVNRYARFTLHPDRIDAVVVADLAELPTAQNPPTSCAEAAAAVTATVDGTAVAWTVSRSSVTFADGAAGLRTSRVDCRLSGPADLGRSAQVTVANRFRDDRIGWREMVATGAGVRLSGSALPTATVSDELRRYPDDLLSSPPDLRSATFATAPGADGVPMAAAAPREASGGAGLFAGAERRLADLVGGREFTPYVGLLAVLLALALGAAHAALPGHGKTVMAAYLAGRHGRARDAVAVGATVTLTHTGAVLILGLVLTSVAGVAGEQVLGWLGVTSGVLVAAIGAAALVTAIRHRTVHHHHHDQDHGPDHHHDHGPDHHHDNGPDHGHHDGPGHGHHQHGPGRWGLAGLGVAGGLVPSPSALIVLLAAAALGRTVFGVLLVLAYGLGMAATLTAAGLLLIRLRDRLGHRFGHRLARFRRWRTAAPSVTAALIVVVGVGLAGRAIAVLA